MLTMETPLQVMHLHLQPVTVAEDPLSGDSHEDWTTKFGILHVWGIKDDYYRLHLNIVMVGFLKTFCTLKVIMVAAVRNKAKLRMQQSIFTQSSP